MHSCCGAFDQHGSPPTGLQYEYTRIPLVSVSQLARKEESSPNNLSHLS